MATEEHPHLPDDLAEPWNALREQVLRALDSMERLLAEAGKDGRACSPGRRLASHPVARKRIVLDFLSWCWCENPDNGHFGQTPQRIGSEYRLFAAWRDTLRDSAKKEIASEIKSTKEYAACREGARKAFPERWTALQTSRAVLEGSQLVRTPRN